MYIYITDTSVMNAILLLDLKYKHPNITLYKLVHTILSADRLWNLTTFIGANFGDIVGQDI